MKDFFTTKDTKSTKFGEIIFRNLRDLRVLRGEYGFYHRVRQIKLETDTAQSPLRYAPAGCAAIGAGAASFGFGLMFKAQVAANIAIMPPAKKAMS